MADKLAAPLETIDTEEGAVLLGTLGTFYVLPSPYAPLVAPENFTDFQTPQSNFNILFG